MSVVSVVGPPGLLTGGLRDASGRFVRTQLTTGRTGDGETVTLPAETVELIRAMEMREEYGSYDNALHAAVRGGNENDVSILLGQGASPNAINELGRSVLFIAAHRGHERIVDVLLAAGARVDGDGTARNSPLVRASENGHLNVVNRLIAAGARVNFPNAEYPGSPLHEAVKNGHMDVVRALIAAGAEGGAENIELFNRKLDDAVEAENENDVMLLLQIGASPNNEYGESYMLQRAASLGNERIVDILLAAGARINKYGSQVTQTPLTQASMNGHLNVVNRLIAAGARVNFPNSEYWAPLNQAALAGHIDVVRALIAAGADVNGMIMFHFFNSFKPPYYEAWKRAPNLDVTAELIRHATNINYIDPTTGNTPLIAAARTGVSDIVRMFLDHGADAHGRNKHGNDAVSVVTNAMLNPNKKITPHDVSEYRKIIEMIKAAQR